MKGPIADTTAYGGWLGVSHIGTSRLYLLAYGCRDDGIWWHVLRRGRHGDPYVLHTNRRSHWAVIGELRGE